MPLVTRIAVASFERSPSMSNRRSVSSSANSDTASLGVDDHYVCSHRVLENRRGLLRSRRTHARSRSHSPSARTPSGDERAYRAHSAASPRRRSAHVFSVPFSSFFLFFFSFLFFLFFFSFLFFSFLLFFSSFSFLLFFSSFLFPFFLFFFFISFFSFLLFYFLFRRRGVWGHEARRVVLVH